MSLVNAVVLASLAGTVACARPSIEAPALPRLAVPWSASECARATDDIDADGLDDGCELALAQAFAPEMVVDSRDCLWRSDPAPPRLSGGYLFAARPASGGVRIAFLPAYFRDCGWTRTVCAFRGRDCGAHAGDSELIVVDVEPAVNPGRWQTTAVFLSAHCFGRADGRC